MRAEWENEQASRRRKIDTGITAQTLKEAWPHDNREMVQTKESQQQEELGGVQRTRDAVEEGHDTAARHQYTESQRAMGRSTILVGPYAVNQCEI